jgi:uncharacterized protein (DUF302 family)
MGAETSYLKPGTKILKHMSYYINKTITCDYDQAIDLVTEALKEEGFGVLSHIDFQQKLKERLGVDIPKYQILGACHPPSAYKALLMEDKIGTMLPCNVIVQQKDNNQVEVSAVDPIASMASIENPGLEQLASEVKEMLTRVIQRL